MTAVGFPVNSDEDFGHYAVIAQFNGEPITHPSGLYRRLTAGGGVELWLETDEGDGLRQMNPHFLGPSRMRLRIESRMQTPRGDVMNNAFQAWALGDEDADHHGVFPLVFDSPDFHLYDDMELPVIEQVQLAAFAETIDLFANEHEFTEANCGGLPYAVKSFVPLHNFSSFREGDPSVAYARISGRVLQTEIIENQRTPKSFCWLKLETYCGEVDVVVDPALLHRPIVSGDIVAGLFWLSGRIPARCSSESLRQPDAKAEPPLETPEDYVQRAQYYGWTRRKHDKAVAILKEGAARFPDEYSVFFLLGNFHQDRGEHREAINAFKRVLEINPADIGAMGNLANSYRDCEEYDAAIALATRWLAMSGDDLEGDGAHYSLALTRAAMGRFDEAERICREDVSAENRVRELGHLGKRFSFLGRHDDAIRLLEDALAETPDDLHLNFALGQAYLCAGARESALKQYEKLVDIDEAWANALLDEIETVH